MKINFIYKKLIIENFLIELSIKYHKKGNRKKIHKKFDHFLFCYQKKH